MLELTMRVTPINRNNIELFYPVDENAELFCGLLKTQALKERDLQIITALGFRVIAALPDNYISGKTIGDK
jgi:hypothetical protein